MFYRQWDKNTIVAHIMELEAKGEPFYSSYINMHYPRLHRAAFRILGNWENAVTIAGFDYNKVKQYQSWNREKIVAGIREAWQKGEDLSWRQISTNSCYSKLAAAAVKKRHFGSWAAALKAAGISHKSVSRYVRWNKELVKSQILSYKKNRVPLNPQFIRNKDSRLYYAARRHYGSWQSALRAAGIE